MNKRLIFAVLIAAFVLPGCGFRRGCSKCNVRSDAPPPSFYAPPPAPCPGACP